MDDKTFFDHLFQMFTKTTHAEDAFWGFEELEDDLGKVYRVFAMTADQEQHDVGSFLREADAEWVTALAGCFPDLVRRLHAALDEADRLDVERDEREQEIGRLSVENLELRQQVQDLEGSWDRQRLEISDLRAQIEARQSKAADVLWKIERPM